MTEEDWLKCDNAETLYAFLRDATVQFKTRWQGWKAVQRFPVSERKWKLFLVACCRRILHLVPTQESVHVVEVTEKVAEGLAKKDELTEVVKTFMDACDIDKIRRDAEQRPWKSEEREAINAISRVFRSERAGRDGTPQAAASAWAMWYLAQWFSALSVHRVGQRKMIQVFEEGQAREQARQAELLRDIMGNPFRAMRLDPSWLAWNEGVVRRLAEMIYQERAFDRLGILADALEDAGCDNADLLAHCRAEALHDRGCWLLDLILGREG